MSATRRILHEPSYILHHYDWSESSLILEVFTRNHGRVALAAKGVKKPSSNFRPVLLPLQPLALSFGAEGEIRALKGAEWSGGHVMPTGDALLSGYYLNELLLRLLARDDPHPALFDAYAATVGLLAHGRADSSGAALRAFELLLLREIGLLPSLDAQTSTLEPLRPTDDYELLPEAGLGECRDAQRPALAGAQWQALHRALAPGERFGELVRACAAAAVLLRPQLRNLLNYHCGVGTLRTRQMLVELQAMQP